MMGEHVTILFQTSFALLATFIIVEGLLLREVLRKLAWSKRFYEGFEGRPIQYEYELPPGRQIPDFSAHVLGSDRIVARTNLEGRESILVFASAAMSGSPEYRNLGTAIHGMWHQVEGNLYVVCHGREKECREFAAVVQIPDDLVLLDEDKTITNRFLMDWTPRALRLDEQARLLKYGEPIPGKDEVASTMRAEKLTRGPATTLDTSTRSISVANEGVSDIRKEDDKSRFDASHVTGACYTRTDTSVSCVLTRFRLRSSWAMISFYFAFRRVRREARVIQGLLQALFLVENPRTCYTLSIWKDDRAIMDFGSLRSHVHAANSAFSPTYRSDVKRPEIWSAQFRLCGVSPHNLFWEGFDLPSLMLHQSAPVGKIKDFQVISDSIQ